MEEEQKKPAEAADMGVVILMLGLYLIVLAFFILLNAISEDSPERRDLVVESVQTGFDFREEGDNVGSDEGADISLIPLYHASYGEIDGILESYLAVSEYKVEQKSERLYVTLHSERFFAPGEVRLIPEMILFFQELAEVLKSPKPGTGVITQVMVQEDENVPAGKVGVKDGMSALELAGRRAALFTRALVEQGLPKEYISAGAIKGPAQIILTFEVFIDDMEVAIGEAKRLKDVLESIGGHKVIKNDQPNIQVEAEEAR